MRIRPCLSAAACLLAARPAAGGEPQRWGLRGAHYLDEGPAVAGEIAIRFGERLSLNPNVEHRFTTYSHYTSANADLHVDFPTSGSTLVWAGVGLGLVLDDPKDNDEDPELELATNFLWAVGFRSGSVMPYIEARVVRTNETVFSIGFGLRF
jgi:hypothetical protein